MSSASRRCSFDALVALALVVFICAVPDRAAAQVLYGSIVGDVKDSTGAAMPGATVLVTNTNNGFKREAVTDGVGHFNLPNLPAGVYSLKATQQGFKDVRADRGHRHHQHRHAHRRDARDRRDGRQRHRHAPSSRRCRPTRPRCTSNLLGQELTNLPGAAGRQLPAGVPHAAGLCPADQFAFDPDQPGAIAGIHGQRHERRPEQHADRRRQHRQRPAAARRRPTSRRSSRFRKSTSSPAAWTPSRGSPAEPRSTCRRAAERMPSTDRDSNTSRTSI